MSKPEFYVTDVSLLATLADKEAELVALRDQARRIHGGEPRWCESCNGFLGYVGLKDLPKPYRCAPCAKIEAQAAEIAALREAVLWLDRQRDPAGVFKPVGMPERAFEAYLRATKERTGE